MSIRRLAAITGAVLAIILVFLLVIDLQTVMAELRSADVRFLVAASAFLLLGLVAFAGRWRALLQNKPPLPYTFHAANAGQAANILLPFRLGEPLRVLIMGSHESVSLAEATSSFVVERLFEQFMRMIALVAAVLFGVGLRLSASALIGGVAFLAVGFGLVAWLINHRDFTLAHGSRLLARLPRISPERAHQAVADLLDNLAGVARPREFLAVMLWSLATWLSFWAYFYLTLLAMDDAFPAPLLLPISLAALALSPPTAPTQPGLFHASVVLPLAALGLDGNRLTAYAVLLHILQMLWLTALGLWGLLATGFSPRTLSQLFKGGKQA